MTDRKHVARGYSDRKNFESFRGGQGGKIQLSATGDQDNEYLVVPKPHNQEELNSTRAELNEVINEWGRTTDSMK